MSRGSTILRNVASNWVGFAINAAVTLALTPFVLRDLGTARYGIWILTSSIIGYYGLLDLGFRDGVTQYLTRYLALKDYKPARECMSSAVAVLGGVGTVILGLSLVAAYVAPHVFNLPAGMEREAFWCILIVGGSTALQFGLQPFSSVFTATQRFDLANAIGVATRLLTAGGIVAALKSGHGLIGVSAVTCSVSAVDYLIRWQVAHRLVPQLSVSWRDVRVERVREIAAFGAWNFLISMNGIVNQHVPNLLIGTMMPIAAVGHYALAMGLVRQLHSILSPVPQVLYPAAAAMHARGDKRGLERLYHDGSRLMLLVTFSVALIAAFWANDFYRLWVGEKYLGGGPYQSVALLFQVLLLSVATNYSTTISAYVLIGAGRVRVVAIALLCGSILNVAVALLLLPHWGLLGVALGTVGASVVINLVALPLLAQRALDLQVSRLVYNAWRRPACAALLQLLLILLIRAGGRPESWIQLVASGFAASCGSALVVVGIGMTATERQRLFLHPLSRLRHLEAEPGRASTA